jgi:hypothetical protein
MSTLAERVQQADVVGLPDWRVAEILNAPDESLPVVVEYQKTSIGYGTILDLFGAEDGAALLESLESASESVPLIKWAMRVLDKGWLDVSSAVTRQQIESLANPPLELLTSAQVETLLDFARTERHPSWAEHSQVEVTARSVGLARGGI